MQRLTALGAKLANLFSDASSSHPTAKDSAHVEASLFESTTPTSAENAPVSTDVVVGHSSAFNSERATGMNKLQQLQFVEMLKEIIVDEAPSIHPGQAEFRVVTARKFRVCPASPKSFCNATVHVATLVTGSGTVVLQGKECEFLADTVEDLWARVLEKAGEVAASREADEKAIAIEEVGRQESSDDSAVSASER